MAEYAIDISAHQGRIDWQTVDVPIAIAKATEGRTFTDPRYTANRDGTRTTRKRHGAYHFARPANRAADDAAHFINIAGAELRSGELAALDAEPHPTAGWPLAPGPESVGWCLDWLEQVQAATGRPPLIYAGRAFWHSHLADQQLLADGRRLWIAEYGVAAPRTTWPYALWQYSSSGSVPGIAGRVDVNRAGTVPLPDDDDEGGFLMALTDEEQKQVLLAAKLVTEGAPEFGIPSLVEIDLDTRRALQGGPGVETDPETGLPHLGYGLFALVPAIAQVVHALRSDLDYPTAAIVTIRTLVEQGGSIGGGTPGETRAVLVAMRDALDRAIAETHG